MISAGIAPTRRRRVRMITARRWRDATRTRLDIRSVEKVDGAHTKQEAKSWGALHFPNQRKEMEIHYVASGGKLEETAHLVWDCAIKEWFQASHYPEGMGLSPINPYAVSALIARAKDVEITMINYD